MRERIFQIIEKSDGDDKLSSFYDYFMIIAIVASLLPLIFKETNTVLTIVDKVTVVLFIIDYVLRWITADYKFQKHSGLSFLKYPVSPMAIIDLISILPSLTLVNRGFRVLRVIRMIRAMRVIRVFKATRYSKSFEIIREVLKESKEALSAVLMLAIGYILIAALIIFNVEPDAFNTFFDAVYWATVSLTTVGYGDIYPVSTAGRIITMVSSMTGIAVIALPSGIITAGYMNALRKQIDENKSGEASSDESSESDRSED